MVLGDSTDSRIKPLLSTNKSLVTTDSKGKEHEETDDENLHDALSHILRGLTEMFPDRVRNVTRCSALSCYWS
jgi:hypothetical protein